MEERGNANLHNHSPRRHSSTPFAAGRERAGERVRRRREQRQPVRGGRAELRRRQAGESRRRRWTHACHRSRGRWRSREGAADPPAPETTEHDAEAARGGAGMRTAARRSRRSWRGGLELPRAAMEPRPRRLLYHRVGPSHGLRATAPPCSTSQGRSSGDLPLPEHIVGGGGRGRVALVAARS